MWQPVMAASHGGHIALNNGNNVAHFNLIELVSHEKDILGPKK